MEGTVLFREFEERDIDFIYRCKNNDKLNEMIVGQYHPFTYEEAEKWVRGCMGEHETYKFWAITTNDDDKRSIGCMSLSEIDRVNRSVCHHGLVLADNEYKDGSAMFEAMVFSLEYAFNILNMHRIYGKCLAEHKVSPHLLVALGFSKEGEHRDAVYQNGRFYNVLDYVLLHEDYENNKNKKVYSIDVLTRRFIQSVKSSKKK